MLPPLDATTRIARVIREDWGRILASLVKTTGDFALAEDALQEAVVTALDQWGQRGLPARPDAWLLTVARRKALDRLRRDASFARKSAEIAYLAELERQAEDPQAQATIPDNRLEMIFTCCHPALEEKSRVALTLRALGGLSTAEIAAAFLDKPATMAARLTRAKQKIARAGIPFRKPDPKDLRERLAGVLRVIYLIFNEGYRANASQQLMRNDLIDEAIRLGRIMVALMGDHAETRGLLGLMLLHDSRRHARIDKAGALVPLEHQVRARWDRGKIREGTALVRAALGEAPPGTYAVQGAISALHAEAADFASTDWAQIAALYEVLWSIEPNPVVRVNQALALSYLHDPGVALDWLDDKVTGVDLAEYQPYHVCRGDLLARLGRREEARVSLQRAVELAMAPAEKDYLSGRIAALRPV